MPTVRVPSPLRRFTENQTEITVSGSTVGAALEDLVHRHPDLRSHLFDARGELIRSTSESVNVLLNKSDYRELQGGSTALGEADRLTVLRTWPAAIGGSRGFNKGDSDNSAGA